MEPECSLPRSQEPLFSIVNQINTVHAFTSHFVRTILILSYIRVYCSQYYGLLTTFKEGDRNVLLTPADRGSD
jgi:hypothetical protein